mmetsp:Transcript_99842/g.282574  ORF Transcript_99842/g.282574 Transcript_99842/m.282574 type:complete len:238 (+) Transcript_99842:736-1449(+)
MAPGLPYVHRRPAAGWHLPGGRPGPPRPARGRGERGAADPDPDAVGAVVVLRPPRRRGLRQPAPAPAAGGESRCGSADRQPKPAAAAPAAAGTKKAGPQGTRAADTARSGAQQGDAARRGPRHHQKPGAAPFRATTRAATAFSRRRHGGGWRAAGRRPLRWAVAGLALLRGRTAPCVALPAHVPGRRGPPWRQAACPDPVRPARQAPPGEGETRSGRRQARADGQDAERVLRPHRPC